MTKNVAAEEGSVKAANVSKGCLRGVSSIQAFISPFGGIDRYVLALLITFQLLAGYTFFTREIAWYPPSNDDQSSYLAESYRTKERILTHGFGQLASVLKSQYYTGLALPVLGAVSGLFLPGGRLPQLFILFAGFAFLQVCAFFTGQAVWRSRSYGYMLLGLILCQNTPWYWAGGLFDFRFDFIAYCIYGVWACAVIRSQLFLHRGWSIGCGIIAAFLVLNRFLTFIYVTGVSAGFAVLCAAAVLIYRNDTDLVQRMSRRLYNLLLSIGILAFLVMPFLILSWRKIFEYYGVGHMLGSVKDARVHQAGINNFMQSLFFYPNSLLRDQWGLTFVLATAIVLLGSLIVFLANNKARNRKPQGHDETFLLQVIFLLGAIVGPLIVLTIDTDKNSVVGGIVGVPTALLLVAVAARIAGSRSVRGAEIPRTVTACSVAVFVLGIVTVVDQLSRHQPEYSQRSDLTRLVELNKWLVNYASAHGWYDPRISFDVVSPWFNGYGITDTGYEETGKFIEFHPLLGSDIMGTDREGALAQLGKSDFLILTTSTARKTSIDSDKTSPEASRRVNDQWLDILRRLNPSRQDTVQQPPSGISLEGSTAAIQRWPMLNQHLYPFYDQLSHYRDDLKDWADKNMTLVRTVTFENFTANVYARPTATM
ncbi:MAG: hypothetical protein JOY96_12445 [Verrucomicrobia bacterium]|nr:hypothetical protein [Verrucomicrobiota bacterium]